MSDYVREHEFDETEFVIEKDQTVSAETKEDPNIRGRLEPVYSGPLSSLSDEQRVRVAALNMAKPLIAEKGLLGTGKAPDISDLIRLANWILEGEEGPLYPFTSGDVLVLGPEVTVGVDGGTIVWRGSRYHLNEEDR